MSAAEPPVSPPSSARPDQTTKVEPKTPQHNRHDIRSAGFSTPIAAGTSILSKLRIDGNQTTKYNSKKYEQYIIEDFERHRVFVDIDVFMKYVLRVPDNWEELWGPTIRQIKRDRRFSKAFWGYVRLCGTHGIREERFYKPLVHMTNAILDISEESESDHVRPKTPQRYLRNDPVNIHCGVMNLCPDVVAVHKDRFNTLLPDEKVGEHLNISGLSWAQPLQVLEVKPWDNALVDGSCIPRLKVDGRDPGEHHARAVTPSRHQKKKKDSPDVYLYGGEKPTPAPESRKRAADEHTQSIRKTVKVNPESAPGGQPPITKLPSRPRTDETEKQKEAYLQVGRYLLEQFSIPAFRSHATVSLVDRDRIQFYHANHSVILVSSAIRFTAGGRGEGLEKFIAIVIAFGRMSLRDNGILHELHNGEMFRDNEKLVTATFIPRELKIQAGKTLVLGGDGKTKSFTLTYGDVVSREPSLAGRATVVLLAKSDSLWSHLELVVKISWPGSNRVAENFFLTKAVETANSSPGDKWALNHLPRVLFSQDIVFDPDSPHGMLATLFAKIGAADKYIYEKRTLRIIVQERLSPLHVLTDVKEIAQVLLDVGCVHRWLYLRAGILHRDFSPNNIMCRIVEKRAKNGALIERKVYGVLTDFDLASWKENLDKDYKKTSEQRTGTPPFMAQGLLDGSETHHLYRHDLESLFYIILILATHYEIQPPTKRKGGRLRPRRGVGELPYQDWFDQDSYKALAKFKRDLFADWQKLTLSPAFEDFRYWLEALRDSFWEGFNSKGRSLRHKYQESEDENMLKFDDETLGGHVHYSALINPVRKLKGNLEGLIIRYDPTF